MKYQALVYYILMMVHVTLTVICIGMGEYEKAGYFGAFLIVWTGFYIQASILSELKKNEQNERTFS